MKIIEKIFYCSNLVKDDRKIEDIFIYLMSEAGELAEEINIKNGRSSKPVGKDGIVGEAVDVILCAFDVIKKILQK